MPVQPTCPICGCATAWLTLLGGTRMAAPCVACAEKVFARAAGEPVIHPHPWAPTDLDRLLLKRWGISAE